MPRIGLILHVLGKFFSLAKQYVERTVQGKVSWQAIGLSERQQSVSSLSLTKFRSSVSAVLAYRYLQHFIKRLPTG